MAHSSFFRSHGSTKQGEDCAYELNIDVDEVLFINSITNFENLMDEGIDIHSPSPRDVVLSNIRKTRPDAFIHSVLNVSYTMPFFVA
jgi:hypothetical protein